VCLLLVTLVLFVLYMQSDEEETELTMEPIVDTPRPMRAKHRAALRAKHRAPAAAVAAKPAGTVSSRPLRGGGGAPPGLRGGDEMTQEAIYSSRQRAVVEEFMHAFEGYRRVAWGHDEVRPESNITNDSWGGFAVTLIDAMDTMMLMGLTEQVKLGRDWIKDNLNFDKDWDASFFEFSIRYLGGLLSAYELSGEDPLYLKKAQDIGDRLLVAFESQVGMPYPVINLKTGKRRTPSWNSGRIVLAEYGSVQLEFKQLSHHLKNRTYFDKADHVMDMLRKIPKDRYIINSVDTYPLLPVYLDIATAREPSGHISLGAMADSYYEYLLKQWLQSDRQDHRYRVMYDEFVAKLEELLIKRSSPNGFMVVGEFEGGHVEPKMDHLVCFLPGLLALGAEGKHEEAHMRLAKGLMETCGQLYETQPTGLAPEIASFRVQEGGRPARNKGQSNRGRHPDYDVLDAKYILRPETIESLFWLWRKTGDPQYREKGWRIFEAIRKHCRTSTAYSGIKDVTLEKPEFNDSMQSFTLAETFKYLYLLFHDKSDARVEEVLRSTVFTTEAHPLRTFDSVAEFGPRP